ncbi:MAG: hypothetical protein DRO99_04020 [Candidatus Aenigmatarchaeota archaeon]|nr:MAG: hypothetical protein DRO99_04020 [Candidatus Aenigmarchaeota archaeon]
MKGQMFIVTIVFLVGLIFSVQQILFQYSYLDVPASYQKYDYYLTMDVREMIIDTITASPSCEEARHRIDDVLLFMNKQATRGYSVKIDARFNCSRWYNKPGEQAPVNVSIIITGTELEMMDNLWIYSNGYYSS